jgi:hypothetical protein
MRRTGGLNGPPSPIHESPFSSARNSPYPGQNQREDYALREHTFIRESENHLDQYLAQGRAVLDNLVEQRGMLKGARTRLLGAANTLGLSRETISWVERRTWVNKCADNADPSEPRTHTFSSVARLSLYSASGSSGITSGKCPQLDLREL